MSMMGVLKELKELSTRYMTELVLEDYCKCYWEKKEKEKLLEVVAEKVLNKELEDIQVLKEHLPIVIESLKVMKLKVLVEQLYLLQENFLLVVQMDLQYWLRENLLDEVLMELKLKKLMELGLEELMEPKVRLGVHLELQQER